MKKIFISAVLFFLGLHLLADVIMPSPDRQKTLNGQWKFKYINSLKPMSDSLFYEPSFSVNSWGELKVPSCWDRMGIVESAYGGAVKEGLGLYRTKFELPKDWKGDNIFIAFDGVGFGYRFWVNGRYAGTFGSSFNRKTFDITPFIDSQQENILAVEVTTRSHGWKFDTCDDWSFSGIFRDVTLFSMPSNYISDVDIVTKVLNNNKATIHVGAKFEGTSNVEIEAGLTDLKGTLVEKIQLKRQKDHIFSGTADVKNPRLWNAESPELYYLYVHLIENGKVTQKQKFRIGLREITIDGATLRLNGTPIKLRGINLHEESPVNGRTMTDEERLRDLELIKKANINFIRTSHYPPNHRLIEMCDSMGFYVMNEVSFAGYGGGRELLAQHEYRDDILDRVRSTIFRDKNYTSVIAWSLGNENPLTENGIEAGKLAKLIDPSKRPYCMPMMGSYFRDVKFNFPTSIDMYAPHYPGLSNLEEFETNAAFNRPFITTEYAHAFGLGFDRIENLWDYIYYSKRIAGGAIWHFFDQGLLRKSKEAVDPNKYTQSVWVDPYTYYDSNQDKGPDGIVYADRTPQSDYWVTRKVYSPVQLFGDTIETGVGKQKIKIVSENRYDFTNLSELTMHWELCAAGKVIQNGTEQLNCPPKQQATNIIEVIIPDKKSPIYTLMVRYVNKNDFQIYEKNYVLNNINVIRITKHEIASNLLPKLEFNEPEGTITLKNYEGNAIIAKLPELRVGRKPALWNLYDFDDTSADSINITVAEAWFPPNISNPNILSIKKESGQYIVKTKYQRAGDKSQAFDGTITYTNNKKGWIDVEYDFKPNNIKGAFLELGISMLLPSSLNEFRFIGKGPYPSYPGKSRHVEPGLYHINSADLNFAGSYACVDIALFSDKNGMGFAIIPNGSGISLERNSNGILLSHTPYVSGTYAKKSMPEKKVSAKNVEVLKGSFTIIPLHGKWPDILTETFGNQNSVAIPFNPFFNYYDK